MLGDIPAESRRWVRVFHPAPQAAVRVVCWPHAGGAASAYFALSSRLAPAVEVLAIQYPGRQDRRGERFPDGIPGLAAAAVEALRPWLGSPLAFFGHSMGAMAAFEAARILAADGRCPAALFVSGRRAPTTEPIPGPPQVWDDYRLLAELRLLSGTDDALLSDSEVREMVLPVVRADLNAVAAYRYRPGSPLPCPIVALVGDDDPKTPVADASQWHRQTTDEFDLRIFPGGHFYLTRSWPEVAAIVESRLRTVSPSA